MEYRPNSNPERLSGDTPPDSPVPPLSKHFAVKRAILLWQGPRDVAYNSLVQQLRFYDDKWPEDTKPTPTTFSEAGFFTQVSGTSITQNPTSEIHFTYNF
jgi:hypothetical protein